MTKCVHRHVRYIVSSLAFICIFAPPTLAYNMFPCAAGNRWEYETVRVQNARVNVGGAVASTTREIQSGSSVYQVTAGPLNGVYDYQELVTLTNTQGKTQTYKTLIKFGVDDKGLYINSTVSENGFDSAPVAQAYSPPLFYFAANADKGKPWDIGVFRDRVLTEAFTAKSTGRETVLVPAGTFNNCLKVVYSSDGASGTFDVAGVIFKPSGGRSVNVYWIAEGVGIVKELEVSISKADADGPDGIKFVMEGSSCTVSELKPGFTVKKHSTKLKVKESQPEADQTSF